MFKLRKATQADSASIRALVRAARINPTGLNWKRFLLAVDAQDVVIGCGQLKPHGKNICELASIAVQPAWRGQGVARAIIENLLKENETGSCEVYLTCRAALEPFYMKFGFDIARGKLPGYFSWVHNLTRILRLLGLTRQAILVMHYRSGGST